MSEWSTSQDAQERALYWDAWARHRSAPEGDEKQQLLREAQQLKQRRVRRYAEVCLGNHLGAADPFAEELVWFWFNHFNVFLPKDHIGMALPDYVERAIRPHVQGRFGDMLLATITHPAMLMYLDNVQNFAGRINENFARELLELHTLGVGGGYSQQDVQEVARVLTGLGVHEAPGSGSPADAPARDRFLFNASRHDKSSKQVLGQTIQAAGLEEVGMLAALLAAHPSTAQHIARRLCTYFVADEPDESVVDTVASVYRSSGGDLKEVTAVVAKAMAGPRQARSKFKDPLRYVVSSVRVLAEGRILPNLQPVSRWLDALGEPLFRRSTPDGYPLRGSDWVSPGQLTRRFDIAREMVMQVPRQFGKSFDSLQDGQALRMLERSLPAPLRDVVSQAADPAARASLLLCCPNHMYV